MIFSRKWILFFVFLWPSLLVNSQESSLIELARRSNSDDNELIITLLNNTDFTGKLALAKGLNQREDTNLLHILDSVYRGDWPQPKKILWLRVVLTDLKWNNKNRPFLEDLILEDNAFDSAELDREIYKQLPLIFPRQGAGWAVERAEALVEKWRLHPQHMGREEKELALVLIGLANVWPKDLPLRVVIARLKRLIGYQTD